MKNRNSIAEATKILIETRFLIKEKRLMKAERLLDEVLDSSVIDESGNSIKKQIAKIQEALYRAYLKKKGMSKWANVKRVIENCPLEGHKSIMISDFFILAKKDKAWYDGL